MIDWVNVAGNSLWILGCALGLATVSYAYWQAIYVQQALRNTLQQRPAQITLNLAASLFCLGLAFTSNITWQVILWLVLAALFAAQIYGIKK